MFTVDNLPILVDEVEVIRTLRDQLALKGIKRFGQIRRTYNNIMVSCPFHKDGQERHPSFGILTVEDKGRPPGTCHCFSCGYAGSLEDVVSRCFGYADNGVFGRSWLLKNFVTFDGEGAERKVVLDVSRDDIEQKINFVSEEELSKYRFYHPYMFKRKLTKEIIELFDVGYDKERDCITFPVRDTKGRTLFVGTRSIKGKKYLYPSDAQKPVYGLYEIKNIPLSELWICEGQINALTCWVYGKPAVALMGTGTDYQYSQLSLIDCRKFILALDPDKAGYEGCIKLKKALKDKMLYRAKIPFKKDINDLSREEFLSLQLSLF